MQTNKELGTVASLLNTKQVWLKLKKSRGFDAAAVAQLHSGLFSPASQVIGLAPCNTEASARRCRKSKSKLNILVVRPGAVSLSCSQKPHQAVIAVNPRGIFLHLVSLVFNEIGSDLRAFCICCPTKPNRVTCCSGEIDPKNRAKRYLFLSFLCTLPSKRIMLTVC